MATRHNLHPMATRHGKLNNVAGGDRNKRSWRRIYPSLFSAVDVLDAVEQWADGCVLLRETQVFRNGRMDGVLIRAHFNSVLKKSGLYGVEVKLRRSDFLKGLNSGQFDRYAQSMNGLYIATSQGVCKTSEIPRQFGHLVVSNRGDELQCVCRRKARYTAKEPLSGDLFWRLLVDCCDQFRRSEQETRREVDEAIEKIKVHAGRKIAAAIVA